MDNYSEKSKDMLINGRDNDDHSTPENFEDACDLTDPDHGVEYFVGKESQLHAYCNDRITELMHEINDLKLKQSSLNKHARFFKFLDESMTAQPTAIQNSAPVVDCDVTSDMDASPLSSRSDKSMSSQASAQALQISIDILGENNRLLHERELFEQKMKKRIIELEKQVEKLSVELKLSQNENVSLESRLANACSAFSAHDGKFNGNGPFHENGLVQNGHVENGTFNPGVQTTLTGLGACQEDYVSLQHEFIKISTERNALKSEKEALAVQYNDLLKQKSALQSKIDEMKNDKNEQYVSDACTERLETENVNLNAQLKNKSKTIQDLDCELKNYKSKFQIKVAEVDHLRKLLTDKSKESFRAEYESTKNELTNALEQNMRLTDELDKLKAKADALGELQRAFDSQNLGLSGLKEVLLIKDKTIKELNEKADALEHKFKEAAFERDELKERLILIQRNLDEKSMEMKDLESEFENWKKNANLQYDDEVSRWKREFVKHVDYPGKAIDEGQKLTLNRFTNTDRTNVATIGTCTTATYSSEFFILRRFLDNLLEFFAIEISDASVANFLAEFKTVSMEFPICPSDKADLIQNVTLLLTYLNDALQTAGRSTVLAANERELKMYNEALIEEKDRLEADLFSAQESMTHARIKYEESIKDLESQLRIKEKLIDRLESNLNDKFDDCTVLEKTCNDLRRKVGDFDKKLYGINQLLAESRSTIQALTNQHATDLKDIDSLKCALKWSHEKQESLSKTILTLRNEIELQAAYADKIARCSQNSIASDCIALEKSKWGLCCKRNSYYRESLIAQKTFLTERLKSYEKTEAEALSKMENDGFLSEPPQVDHRRHLFRIAARIVLAVIKIKNLHRENVSLSMS